MAVYPCTHRERHQLKLNSSPKAGISLYPQGTLLYELHLDNFLRYIPVPTGNAAAMALTMWGAKVYPCTYRELHYNLHFHKPLCGISLYLQGTLYKFALEQLKPRYIPVPTGNSFLLELTASVISVYPCTYRELSIVY